MFDIYTKLDEKSHIQPRLTAMLSCADNMMPVSWHMPVSKEPFRYAVAIRKENDTHDLVKEHKEFSLNFLEIEHHDAYDLCGKTHGSEVDKFQLTGLKKKAASCIKYSVIDEAYLIYECSVIDVISYGDHNLFIADVEMILNKDIHEISPTLFLGKGYYDTLTGEAKRVEKR